MSVLAGQEVNTRTIEHDPQQTLQSRLLPTDKSLVVTRSTHGLVSMTEPTVDIEISYAAGISDVVVVAELLSAEAALIEQDSWVGTKLNFRVVETVTPTPIRELKTMDVIWNGGGDLIIQGVTVRAGLPWRGSASRRYLLFVKLVENRQVLMRTPLAVEDGTLVNPWQRDGIIKKNDVLHGQSVDGIKRRLR